MEHLDVRGAWWIGSVDRERMELWRGARGARGAARRKAGGMVRDDDG